MIEKSNEPFLKEHLLNQKDNKGIDKSAFINEKITSNDVNILKSLNIETQDSEHIKDSAKNDENISLKQKFQNRCNKYLVDEHAEPNYSILSLVKFILVFWIYSIPLMLNFCGPSV